MRGLYNENEPDMEQGRVRIRNISVMLGFQYLQYRFDSRLLVLIGWIVQVLTQIVYVGIVLYAPAAMMQLSECYLL